MRYLLFVPLLVIPLIVYNIVLMAGGDVTNQTVFATLPLMSSPDGMPLGGGDLLVIAGVVLLYFELLKAARMSRSTIVDHALSLLVFIIYLIEVIVVAGAGTSTFLILMLMALLDVVAGFTITISTARRDIGLSADAFGGGG